MNDMVLFAGGGVLIVGGLFLLFRNQIGAWLTGTLMSLANSRELDDK